MTLATTPTPLIAAPSSASSCSDIDAPSMQIAAAHDTPLVPAEPCECAPYARRCVARLHGTCLVLARMRVAGTPARSTCRGSASRGQPLLVILPGAIGVKILGRVGRQFGGVHSRDVGAERQRRAL